MPGFILVSRWSFSWRGIWRRIKRSAHPPSRPLRQSQECRHQAEAGDCSQTQFLDFARHYGFSVYPCTPAGPMKRGEGTGAPGYSSFLTADAFTDMNDLNRKLTLWRTERNGKVHRTTGKTPGEMLQEEKLKTLPQLSYKACRMQTGMVSPTAYPFGDQPLFRSFRGQPSASHR